MDDTWAIPSAAKVVAQSCEQLSGALGSAVNPFWTSKWKTSSQNALTLGMLQQAQQSILLAQYDKEQQALTADLHSAYAQKYIKHMSNFAAGMDFSWSVQMPPEKPTRCHHREVRIACG